MGIKVRRYRYGPGFELDITYRRKDGVLKRYRCRACDERGLPILPTADPAKDARRCHARALQLIGELVSKERRGTVAPTLGQFFPRFIADHCQANRQKHSGIHSKWRIYELYLQPHLGRKRLSDIATRDVEALKGRLAKLSPKTCNNALTVLGKALRVAFDWQEIDVLPCRIKFLKTDAPVMEFYEFEDYDHLVDVAELVGRKHLITVLLAGDAGLRAGEILALEWRDLDFKRRHIHIQRSEWRGKVDKPKGGKFRMVPMSDRLAKALQDHRSLRGPRVLERNGGEKISDQTLRTWVAAVEKRAGLRESGRGGRRHILRHTFGSHLAMRGASVVSIKELMGHASLKTTARYMHLAPSEKDKAIATINQRRAETERAGRKAGKATR